MFPIKAHALPLMLAKRIFFHAHLASLVACLQSVQTALKAAFLNCGQNCAGGERFFVHAKVCVIAGEVVTTNLYYTQNSFLELFFAWLCPSS